MGWSNIVEPKLDTKDYAGMCLQFTQTVWGAPVKYRTAWDSWVANPDKQRNRDIPEVGCLIWFDHWGTYGGFYGQYGHVVSYIPGKGFLSSPASGFGQLWLDSIEAVERTFNSKFLGWTPSINGLTVAKYVNDPSPKRKNNDMRVVRYKGADFLVGQQFISISPNPTVTALINSLYGDSLNVGDDWPQMVRITRVHGIPDNTFDFLYNNNRADFGYAWSAERGLFKPEEA
jgi:hypothetical protein